VNERQRSWMRLALAFIAGVLVFPLAVVVVGSSGLAPIAATDKPSGLEEQLGQISLRASLARRAKGLVSPVKGDDPEVLLQGMKMYRRNCSGCHGRHGAPSRWGTSSFYPRVPQFADAMPALSGPEMFVAIKHGIRLTGMAAWAVNLQDEEIWTVVAFLQRMGNLPPEVDQAWKSG